MLRSSCHPLLLPSGADWPGLSQISCRSIRLQKRHEHVNYTSRPPAPLVASPATGGVRWGSTRLRGTSDLSTPCGEPYNGRGEGREHGAAEHYTACGKPCNRRGEVREHKAAGHCSPPIIGWPGDFRSLIDPLECFHLKSVGSVTALAKQRCTPDGGAATKRRVGKLKIKWENVIFLVLTIRHRIFWKILSKEHQSHIELEFCLLNSLLIKGVFCGINPSTIKI